MTEEIQARENQNSSNEVFYKRFAEERSEWTSKIQDMAERMKNIYELADLQTDLYSQRQIALDYSHALLTHLTKINRIYRERKNERWEYYTRNYDLRMDKDPKELHIAVDLADVVERKELLQNHLDFIRETIKTIDTQCFGVKHRIALEEYRRG